MRVSEQQKIGKDGEHAVIGHFRKIGWEPSYDKSYDVGTDFFVHALDPERFDLGVQLGVQVKTGSSYFRDKVIQGDELIGWWYYESNTRHFDHWSQHSVPHLLVLHDLSSETSHWVHVTEEALVSTGKGCKILVPAGQTIDEAHRDDILVVAYKRPTYELEGSALAGEARDIPQEHRLRHALVAPRLVVPHRNSGFRDEIDAVQAVALLTQGRFRDLKQFAKQHQSVPDPESTNPDPDWTWRFVAAIWDWAQNDSITQLKDAFESALENRSTVASGIFLACALQRIEQYDEALEVLDKLVAIEGLESADYGWALVQRARTRTEVGDRDGCRTDATTAKNCLEATKKDVTVSAFAAAASSQLFAFKEPRSLNESDFRGLLAAADHTVSWWRSLTISWALSDSVDSQFKAWTENRSHVWISEDREALNLFSAELMADLAGEHTTWRATSALGARQKLIRAATSEDEQAQLTEGLDTLRRSGDNQSLRAAITHLHRVGPIKPVATAIEKVPLNGWTHTTAAANFEALAQAGDLLNEQVASEFLIWSARIAAGDSAEFIILVRPMFAVEHYALKAVARLLPAAGPPAHRELASILSALPTPTPDSLVQDLAAIVEDLGFDLIAESEREGLWALCERDQGPVGNATLGWFASNGNLHARTQLKARSVGGDLDALSTLGDVTALDTSEAAVLIPHVERMVAAGLSDARNHKYSLGGFDVTEILTLLNLWFPDQASWDTVLSLLSEPLVSTRGKRRTCYLISRLSTRLPEDVQSHLRSNIEDIQSATPFFGGEPGIGGTGLMLAIATGAIGEEAATVEAMKLASGSPRDRCDLARLLGLGQCSQIQSILAALVGDGHFEVRRVATTALGQIVCNDSNTSLHDLVWDIANKDGTDLPVALLVGLARGEAPLPEIGSEIVQQLKHHRSALVRGYANRLLR